MARTPKGTPPSYPQKPHNGQARLTVRLLNGRRHDIILGPYGSPESRAEYRRVLAELEVHGGRFPLKQDGTVAFGLTVNELCLRFWKHGEKHYRLADGSPSGELDNYKYAQGVLLDLYDGTLASEFGPLRLKAVRQRMIDTYRYLVRFTADDRTWERWVMESQFRHGAGQDDRRECEVTAGEELLQDGLTAGLAPQAFGEQARTEGTSGEHGHAALGLGTRRMHHVIATGPRQHLSERG